MGYQDSDHASLRELAQGRRQAPQRPAIRNIGEWEDADEILGRWKDFYVDPQSVDLCMAAAALQTQVRWIRWNQRVAQMRARRAARRWVSQVLNPSHALLCACCITISGVS